MDQTQVDAALRGAADRRRQEQMLAAMLRQTMGAPAVVKRCAPANLVEISRDGEAALFHVALPNGERWDIPLNPHQCRLVARALTEEQP